MRSEKESVVSRHLLRKLSITTRAARDQFAIGVILLALIPVLLLIYVQYDNQSEKAFALTFHQLIAAAFAVMASVGGYLLLRKYPANIRRLREYMEQMVQGQLPERVTLLDLEDDIAALEMSMNMILEAMRERESGLRMEKEELVKQLYEMQKLESIGRVARRIAHEFNNLLMAISGYSELVLAGIGPDETVRGDVIQISRSCARATALVRQILAFGGRQSLVQEPRNLNALISEMKDIVVTLLGQGIEFKTDLAQDLHTVNIDAGRIQQVITNLVENARDAMPGEGKLLIKTENVVVDESLIKTMPGASAGSFVRLIVEDNGIGMNKFILARLFEPFFSAKKEKGAGLGLATAHGIVKQHGGWINVYSEAGHGSTFRIYLPAAAAGVTAPGGVKEGAAVVRSVYGRGEHILLVDDDTSIRDFAARTLRSHGYRVIEASDGESAWRLFEDADEEVDLVFSDVMLPGSLNGVSLVEKLLVEKPGIKVLLCSGYAEEKIQWPVIREKQFKFLRKPYPMVDMLNAVREIIEARTR